MRTLARLFSGPLFALAGLNHFALRTGCRLVAEGVETQAEADTLRELGIEYAQGYLYGRPVPIDQVRRA